MSSLLLREIMNIRMYPIIKSLAYIEKPYMDTKNYSIRSKSFDVIKEFISCLAETVPSEETMYYKDKIYSLLESIIFWKDKDLKCIFSFSDCDNANYIKLFVIPALDRVYTPTFDKEFKQMNSGEFCYEEYKKRKLEYVINQSNLYLEHAKEFMKVRNKKMK